MLLKTILFLSAEICEDEREGCHVNRSTGVGGNLCFFAYSCPENCAINTLNLFLGKTVLHFAGNQRCERLSES